jgi:hypothetical protein
MAEIAKVQASTRRVRKDTRALAGTKVITDIGMVTDTGMVTVPAAGTRVGRVETMISAAARLASGGLFASSPTS